MMKKGIHILLLLLLGVLVACQEEKFTIDTPAEEEVPEGYVRLNFSATISPETEVVTRNVDIDGGGIQSITLFCFDEYGLFISTTTTTTTTGVFKTVVPQNTRIIHFLANQNMTNYSEDDFRLLSESEVMGVMEGSSGRMIYWARYQDLTATTGKAFADGLAMVSGEIDGEKDVANGVGDITLLRNHAYVTIQNTADNLNYFETTGFVVYNTPAFGTVAPYDHDKNKFPSIEEFLDGNYVTLPENRTKMSNISGVNNATQTSMGELFGQFIFECENDQQDPVSVILRGRNKKSDGTWGDVQFYRVMLQDASGAMIKLRRNHHYILNVVGNLNYGVGSFNDALDAPATNNIFISIGPEILEVGNKNYRLAIPQEAYVLTGTNDMTNPAALDLNVHYNLAVQSTANAGTALPARNDIKVSWVGDQNVAQLTTFDTDATHLFNTNTLYGSEYFGYPAEYNGQINLTLNLMGSEQIRKGTLLIKYGQLQRQISIVTVQEQSFHPVWVSSQLYAGDASQSGRAHATLMFTVPETTPKELFPMRVLISTDRLGIRSNSGQKLPIALPDDEEWFGASKMVDENGNEIADATTYKYVLEVTEPGVQRVYFENITTETQGTTEYVMIEAEHFAPITKKVIFNNELLSIALPTTSTSNMQVFKAGTSTATAADDNLYFLLVPRKRYADVSFSMELHYGRGNDFEAIIPNTVLTYDNDGSIANMADASAYDEFLLYSQYLEVPVKGEDGATTQNPGVTFVEADPSNWSTNGRVHVFTVNDASIQGNYGAAETDGWDNPADPEVEGRERYPFRLHFRTTRAISAEPIRIASNETAYSYWNLTNHVIDPTKPYKGRTFRSRVFELYNFIPFRFAAEVDFDGTILGNYASDATEKIEFPYAEPNTPVNIGIDITSFASNPQQGALQQVRKSVDPFGEEFEIYIDAPMLEIDQAALTALNWAKTPSGIEKLREDPNTPGRFIYTVDKNRNAERVYGNVVNGDKVPVKVVDNTTLTWDSKEIAAEKQIGERRILPFRTRDVITAGDIVISSNKEKVDFTTKTFTVSNPALKGFIETPTGPIGAGEFVVVEKASDHSRIASMTITDVTGTGDNQQNYSLMLRPEYDFGWDTQIKVSYTTTVKDNTGKDVSITFSSGSGLRLRNLIENPNLFLNVDTGK